MIKKEVTYRDFNDMERTDELYFHMTQPELIKLSVSKEGGFQRYLNKIIQSNNMKEIVDTLDEVIRLSYGEKTDDGRFVKNPEILDKFISSEAYNTIFMEVAQSSEKAAEFINGVIPKMPTIQDQTTENVVQMPTS